MPTMYGAIIERPNPAELARDLEEGGLEYRYEPYRLRAGGESHWYFDAKFALSRPGVLGRVGQLAVLEANRRNINCQIICAMGGGGYALMHAMVATDPPNYAMTWAYMGREDDPDNGLHGAKVEGRKLLVVDDVLSTGSSLSDTIAMIQHAGGEVTDALVMVTRSNGQAEDRLFNELGVACYALFRLSENEGMILPVV